jgi:phospholipid transport system transporter-binding protein
VNEATLTTHELSGSITLEVAADLYRTGLVLPQGVTQMTIDWSKVEAVDSSAISLMLAWQRAAQRQNVQLHFINLPENLLSLANLYGVTELLTLQ